MSKLAKATIGLMIVTMLAKVLGFIREIVLASSYGTTIYADAYLTAINIPSVFFIVLGTALGATFIPMYFEIERNIGKEGSLKYTNNILNILLLLCILTLIIGVLLSEPIVRIFAFGFNNEKLDITINFTKILFISIGFSGISYIMTSYLNANDNFIVPGLISIPRNIITIISIILSIKYGIYIMVWGTLFGIASELLFQIPFAIKYGYKYKVYINIKDKYIKKSIMLLGPVLIGVAVSQINVTVDRALASTLSDGAISSLNYANKLNGFVMGLFVTSIVSVIYPRLSKLSAEKNTEKLVEIIRSSINSIILIIIPITVGAIVLATPIVRLLFQRGAFDEMATQMTSIALIMYSIGMVSFGLRDILGKIFISFQDTKTPMINGVICMFMNIAINLILIKYFKHAGLALATSISGIISILIFFRDLKKKIGYFGQDKIIKTTLKSLASAMIMGVVTYFTYSLLTNVLGFGFIQEIIALFGSIAIGAIVYGVLVIVLKVEEVNMMNDMVKRKMSV